MTGAATACAWLVAGVLAWAALAKLRRPQATAVGFRQLGVPLPGLAAVLVPAGELFAAGLLLARPALGSGAALALLIGFSVFLAWRLRRGTPGGCACFGGGPDRPLGPAALVRNALLAVAAAAAAAAEAGLPSLPGMLAVGAAAAVGAVVVALVELGAATGRVWDNRVGPQAGERR